VSFQQAIKSSPAPVRDVCLAGKQGMKGGHRGLVYCADTKRFLGSFDLDRAYAGAQPNANHWDYGLGFKEKNKDEVMVWLEVHPATTSEVNIFLRKYDWLKNWLRTEAKDLAVLTKRKDGQKCFFWLATDSGVNIRQGSQHAKRLQAVGFDLPRQKIILT
jgi:hypothetical protein